MSSPPGITYKRKLKIVVLRAQDIGLSTASTLNGLTGKLANSVRGDSALL